MKADVNLYLLFAQRFAVNRLDGPAIPTDKMSLDHVEQELDTCLPQTYREFLCTCGPLHVAKLWEADIDLHPDTDPPPPSEFLTPQEVIDDTRLCWTGGMPTDFIAIASDGCGNLYGFRKTERSQPRPLDLPVLFFDHDFIVVKLITSSFNEWLVSYLRGIPE
jgi:hypothetical protein